MANPKLAKFKEALEKYEAYKSMLKKQMSEGKISKENYNKMLSAKCQELDL